MRWESWSEFWAMGGYAVYVWGSMGAVVLMVVVETLQARLARRKLLTQLRAEQVLAKLPAEEWQA
jgi:heme exporter protein D